jgi:hypothetical protein
MSGPSAKRFTGMSRNLMAQAQELDPAITREVLLNLLDQEIAYAQSEEQRSGWTLWALGGALAAAALLLLTTWEAGPFSLQTTAKWVLVIALPADLAINLLWTWSGSPVATRRTYRYLHEIEHQQVALSWRAFHFLGVLSIALWLSHDVLKLAVYFVVGWYALLAIFGIVLIPLASAELPYLQKPVLSKWGGRVFGALLSVLMAGSMYAYVITLPPLLPGTRTTELKVALLLVSSSYLIFRLLMGIRQPWQVRRLVTTRRELALGQMDLLAAVRTTRAALIGGGPQLALEEHLTKTLALASEARECAARAQSLIVEYVSGWANLEEQWGTLRSQDRKKRLDLADNSLDAIEEATKELRKWITRVQGRQVDFNRHYGQMQRESPASFAEGREAVAVLYQEVQQQSGWITGMGDWAESQTKLMREQWQGRVE